MWFESGFDAALVHLIPYLHIVDARLADLPNNEGKTYNRDAYLFSKIRQALGVPGEYTSHYRDRFRLFDRTTGCRLLTLADLDSLLQPTEEVGYRLDLYSGREVRIGDLSELGIPITDRGWNKPTRRRPRRRRVGGVVQRSA